MKKITEVKMESLGPVWDKKISGLLKDLEKQVGPQSLAQAMNRVARAAQSRSVKEVARDVGIKQAFIRKRVHRRKSATKEKPWVVDRAHIRPIPAIELAPELKAQSRPGNKVRQVKANKRRSGRKQSKLGGVTVGNKFIPMGFVQKARKTNGRVHVFQRKQKATWAGPGKRAPYDVVRYHTKDSFRRNMPRIYRIMMRARFNKEYDQAFQYNIARALNRN